MSTSSRSFLANDNAHVSLMRDIFSPISMTRATAKELLVRDIEGLEPPLNEVQVRPDGKIVVSNPQAIGIMNMRSARKQAICEIDPTLFAED